MTSTYFDGRSGHAVAHPGAQMNLALVEMRRSKLRFGLLAGAVSCWSSSCSCDDAVERSGQLDHWRSERRGRGGAGLPDTARDNLQASRLQPDVVDRVTGR